MLTSYNSIVVKAIRQPLTSNQIFSANKLKGLSQIKQIQENFRASVVHLICVSQTHFIICRQSIIVIPLTAQVGHLQVIESEFHQYLNAKRTQTYSLHYLSWLFDITHPTTMQNIRFLSYQTDARKA